MNAMSLDLQLHLQRSHCINAFVELEKALFDVAEKIAPGRENELISQRIIRLREVPASPQFSKNQRNLLRAALDEAELLITIRNDIVHGALKVLSDGNMPTAAFINVRQAEWLAPVARLMTAAQLEDMSSKVQSLSERLTKAVMKPVKEAKPA